MFRIIVEEARGISNYAHQNTFAVKNKINT